MKFHYSFIQVLLCTELSLIQMFINGMLNTLFWDHRFNYFDIVNIFSTKIRIKCLLSTTNLQYDTLSFKVKKMVTIILRQLLYKVKVLVGPIAIFRKI